MKRQTLFIAMIFVACSSQNPSNQHVLSEDKALSKEHGHVKNLLIQDDREPESLPSWVLFGLGQRALKNKNYAKAIVVFRQAIERKGIYPEAEWALAQIAGLNGNLRLQEALLEKALDESDLLIVPQDRICILYDLAKVRQLNQIIQPKEKNEAALEVYRDLLREEKMAREKENPEDLEKYFNGFMASASTVIFKTERKPSLTAGLVGLNRLVYFYPAVLCSSLRAHQEIARLSLANHAYKMTIAECLFSLTAIFSTVIQEVQKIHPDYTFRHLAELLIDKTSPVYLGRLENTPPKAYAPSEPNPYWFARYQPIWDYLEESRAKETLELLAKALDRLAKNSAFTAVSSSTRSLQDAYAEAVQWTKALDLSKITETAHG